MEQCDITHPQNTHSMVLYPSSLPHAKQNQVSFMERYTYMWASLVAQLVKNPPAMQETPVNSSVGKIRWKG